MQEMHIVPRLPRTTPFLDMAFFEEAQANRLRFRLPDMPELPEGLRGKDISPAAAKKLVKRGAKMLGDAADLLDVLPSVHTAPAAFGVLRRLKVEALELSGLALMIAVAEATIH